MGDLYFWLLYADLWQLLVGLLLYFIATSAFFGAILFITPGELRREGEPVPDFLGAWLIAMAVLASTDVGAGVSGAKQAVYLVEGILQLCSLALLIGVVVDRVTAPHARIIFSNVAVLTTHQGRPALTFRLARERSGVLLDAELRVYVYVRCAFGSWGAPFILLDPLILAFLSNRPYR